MKNSQINPPDLSEMLLSGDYRLQNQALKLLFTNKMVNAKVQEWAKLYNIRDKTPDDILQEAVILLFDLVLDGRFRRDSKVETFLLGICKNLIRDSSKKIARVQYKEALTDADLYSKDDFYDSVVLVEEKELESQRDNALGEVMSQLTQNCQDSLKMYYFNNKNMCEIAEARQLANADQAKKAVHRCRESLRNLIKDNKPLQYILNQFL